ncbi:porin, partial [Bradyrhizobium erythrophlei]|uniref:porin n=1 Tax=Bradyrhizobium erythrophlei TaxID=1437360 RepID=UPI0035E71131
SQFSAPWTNYPANNFDGLVGGGGTVTGVNQFTYTAQFGNGVSLALSAQDQTQYYQAGVNNILAGGAYGTSDYAGTISPDLVAALRVDQSWGLFQASFAAHDNHAAYYGGSELTGHPDDKWGWAAQLALSIKDIPTGPGDSINIQGVYTDGATRYNIQDLAGQFGAATVYGGTNLPGAYQSIGFGFAPDTVFGAIGGVNTQQQTIKTWGFRGGFNHNWNPYWSSGLYGAYAAVMYNDTAKTLLCGVGGVGGSVRTTLNALGGAITTCNPDYNIAQVGLITRWTPVKNLTFSGDVTWMHLDQKYAGTVVAPSAAIGKPAALYELKNQDTVTLLLRAQRNW